MGLKIAIELLDDTFILQKLTKIVIHHNNKDSDFTSFTRLYIVFTSGITSVDILHILKEFALLKKGIKKTACALRKRSYQQQVAESYLLSRFLPPQ